MTDADPKPRFSLRRFLPLIVLAGTIGLVFAMGWQDYLRPRVIADSTDALQAFVAQHRVLAVALYMAVYIVVVALSIPGAAILTLLGGFLYGWYIAGPATVIAATIGATIIFLVAKTSVGDVLRARAGPFLDRLAKGFEEDAFNYLLFLRLVPVFPFWLVNIAPAFLGVRIRTYFITTLFGIIPGTLAYSYVGGSLDSIFTSAQADAAYQACLAQEAAGAVAAGSCSLPVDFSDLITPQILIAIIALGVVALIPVVIRRVRARRGLRVE
jgi:uncharacterized membrane protein YdjX (TVP38/TMEM64 family)